MVQALKDRIMVGILEAVNISNKDHPPLDSHDYDGEIFALKNGVGIALWSGRYVR